MKIIIIIIIIIFNFLSTIDKMIRSNIKKKKKKKKKTEKGRDRLRGVRNMAKIKKILNEHILVTPSFSTALVVPSRVRFIAVTGVYILLRFAGFPWMV